MNEYVMTGAAKRVIAYELAGFGLVVLLLWADELLDIPQRLFGAGATPVNWVESAFESAFVLALCAFVVFLTWRFLRRIRYLEGFLPVCSFCKKIRVGDEWIPIEVYVSERSEAVFSHSLCPECTEEHYGDYV